MGFRPKLPGTEVSGTVSYLFHYTPDRAFLDPISGTSRRRTSLRTDTGSSFSPTWSLPMVQTLGWLFLPEWVVRPGSRIPNTGTEERRPPSPSITGHPSSYVGPRSHTFALVRPSETGRGPVPSSLCVTLVLESNSLDSDLGSVCWTRPSQRRYRTKTPFQNLRV